MAFIPAPANTIRVTFEGTLRSERWAIVQHMINEGDPLSVATANGLFAVFASSFINIAGDYALSEQVIFERVIVRDVEDEGGVEVTSTSAPEPGYTEYPALPNEVAIAVSWRTGLSGRSYRGRSYLPGVPTAHVDGDDFNHMSAAALGGLQSAATDYIAQLAAGDFTLAIASYFSGTSGPPNHTPTPRALAVITPVTSALVNARLDSQRRRMPRN